MSGGESQRWNGVEFFLPFSVCEGDGEQEGGSRFGDGSGEDGGVGFGFPSVGGDDGTGGGHVLEEGVAEVRASGGFKAEAEVGSFSVERPVSCSDPVLTTLVASAPS